MSENTIFAGGFFGVSDPSELVKIFKEYGEIERLVIPFPRDGYGFVFVQYRYSDGKRRLFRVLYFSILTTTPFFFFFSSNRRSTATVRAITRMRDYRFKGQPVYMKIAEKSIDEIKYIRLGKHRGSSDADSTDRGIHGPRMSL